MCTWLKCLCAEYCVAECCSDIPVRWENARWIWREGGEKRQWCVLKLYTDGYSVVYWGKLRMCIDWKINSLVETRDESAGLLIWKRFVFTPFQALRYYLPPLRSGPVRCKSVPDSCEWSDTHCPSVPVPHSFITGLRCAKSCSSQHCQHSNPPWPMGSRLLRCIVQYTCLHWARIHYYTGAVEN